MIREIICRIFGHKWSWWDERYYGIVKCLRCHIDYSDWKRQNREMMK